jgi:hypothetical protein
MTIATRPRAHALWWLVLAFFGDLLGCAAIVYIVQQHPTATGWDREGALSDMLFFGFGWAAIATYVLLYTCFHILRSASITTTVAGLFLAIAALPLAVLLNGPSITPNPIAAFGLRASDTLVGLLWAVSVLEYSAIAFAVGARGVGYLRKNEVHVSRVAVFWWLGLAGFFLLQVPIAMAIAGDF